MTNNSASNVKYGKQTKAEKNIKLILDVIEFLSRREKRCETHTKKKLHIRYIHALKVNRVSLSLSNLPSHPHISSNKILSGERKNCRDEVFYFYIIRDTNNYHEGLQKEKRVRLWDFLELGSVRKSQKRIFHCVSLTSLYVVLLQRCDWLLTFFFCSGSSFPL